MPKGVVSEKRMGAVEQAVLRLQQEAAADRKTLYLLLDKLLQVTDRQTQVVEMWAKHLEQRAGLFKVEGKPRVETLTDEKEFERWAAENAPHLLDSGQSVPAESL